MPDAVAEQALVRAFRENGLFRAFDHGPLRGLTLTPDSLGQLLAEARLAERPATRRRPRRDGAPPSRPVDEDQRVRFCTTGDGVRIAYTSVGTGPTVVRVISWFTHLDFERDGPLWGHWVARLSAHLQLVRYDGRGHGLSDRDVRDLSHEAKVRDLEAVLDALPVRRVTLLGISEGGATAIAYAARHPQRVSRLILYDAVAHYGVEPKEAAMLDAWLTLVRQGWGQETPAFRQMFSSLFFPDADAAFFRWHSELQRRSATLEAAAAYLAALPTTDVRPLLAHVTAPTLVIHRRGDASASFEAGRELAAGIPGARLLPLEGRNHLPLPEEPEAEAVFAAIVDFVAEQGEPTTPRAPGAPASR